MQRQRRIGLTGGIASGKSSVGRLLEAGGWPVLDADRYSREALAPGTTATRQVIDHFGPIVMAEQHTEQLDRTALGRLVFSDASARSWLEQLIHPIVQTRMSADLDQLSTAPIVVLMIPLLFEVGLTGLCSEVWLVDCEESQQLERLMLRNGLSEADARARLAAQWPMAEKRQRADLIIDNRGSPEELSKNVEQLMFQPLTNNQAAEQPPV